jgi:hypothetical protein
MQYPVWVCLDHGGFATKKALKHVIDAGGRATTVDAALEECWDGWNRPSRIAVKPRGKFHEVTEIEYPKVEAKQATL